MRAILITLHPTEEVVVLINVLAADYEVAQLKQIPLARNFLSLPFLQMKTGAKHRDTKEKNFFTCTFYVSCSFFSREQEMNSGFRIFSKT